VPARHVEHVDIFQEQIDVMSDSGSSRRHCRHLSGGHDRRGSIPYFAGQTDGTTLTVSQGLVGVHVPVGGGDERVERATVRGRRDRGPDRDPQVQPLVPERDRIGNRTLDPVPQQRRFGVCQIGEDGQELVTADPADQVLGPQAVSQARCDDPQRLVPGVMTELVVDRLEPVEAAVQDRDGVQRSRPEGLPDPFRLFECQTSRATVPAPYVRRAGTSGRRDRTFASLS
jgi:hypothetical protein